MLLALSAAGCSSMPPFDAPPDDRHGYPTVSQVVDKIDCEIAAAREDPEINTAWVKARLREKNPPLQPFDNWIASVNLGLTVESTEGITPNSSGLTLSVIEPLKLAQNTFGFGVNPVLYQSRQRIFQLIYTIDISKIKLDHCATKQWHDYNLEGDLGLKEQIFAGLHSIVRNQDDTFSSTKTGSEPDSFGGTVSFDVYKGMTSAGPTFTLTRFKGATGGLGVVREDKHSVVITFVPQSINGKGTNTGTPEAAKEAARFATSNLLERAQLSGIANATSRQ
jgi:hypothetical protein